MLFYYNELSENKQTISCDMVRIKFVLRRSKTSDFSSYFDNISKPNFERYPQTSAPYKYRFLFKLSYALPDSLDIVSATLGFCFNGDHFSDEKYFGFIEYNPNKLFQCSLFKTDLAFLKSICSRWEVLRTDIALDIQSDRQYVYLQKDKRAFECKAYSFEYRTEYLGKRNAIGRVKVYNKQAESSLNYPLTRIEVTCLPNTESFLNNFPKVFDFSRLYDKSIDDIISENQALLELSANDRVLIKLLQIEISNCRDNGLMLYNSLSSRKKQKIGRFIIPDSCLVCCSTSLLNNFFRRFNALI